MQHNARIPLKTENLESYNFNSDTNRSVVRLFDKTSKHWHAGFVSRIVCEGAECTIYAKRAIRFGHHHQKKSDPLDPSDQLITEHDAPISGSLEDDGTEFKLMNPLVASDKETPGILAIESDERDAILSIRSQDAQSVKLLLECKPHIRR